MTRPLLQILAAVVIVFSTAMCIHGARAQVDHVERVFRVKLHLVGGPNDGLVLTWQGAKFPDEAACKAFLESGGNALWKEDAKKIAEIQARSESESVQVVCEEHTG